MPVPTHIRNKIIEWINKGIPYTEIIEKVDKEGYSISRGGITYIKTARPKKITEQSTEQKTKQTKQKEDQKSESPKDNQEKKAIKPPKKRQISKDFLLSELEFKILENAFNVVYQSNYKRLKNNRASGILNALNTIKDTIEIIKKRGNFE